jgi:DNA polymerase III subunit beta
MAMEIRIQKTEFLRGLRLAQSIADRKSTMPMLANVLLRATDSERLLVAATDLNVSVSAELASVNKAEGGITVGAKALHDIVSSMPAEDIELVRRENNWAEIRGGKVKYRLVGMPDRDFPKLPDHREVEFSEVAAPTLREMIDKTLFSVCNDETRFHLNGVFFESDGKQACMVSTDGHRLSKVVRPLEAPALTAGIIIPKKGVGEIKRTLDAGGEICEVAIATPYFYLRSGTITLAVKLIESEFPPYDQVIPKEHKRSAKVDRALLLDALKRAQLMSSETRGVKLGLEDDKLDISGDNPDVGEVREELPASCEGGPLAIGFNPKYVLDLLAHMEADQVVIELGDELDPCLIRPSEDQSFLGVVMPMRI